LRGLCTNDGQQKENDDPGKSDGLLTLHRQSGGATAGRVCSGAQRSAVAPENGNGAVLTPRIPHPAATYASQHFSRSLLTTHYSLRLSRLSRSWLILADI
jgi:hypothetical protein